MAKKKKTTKKRKPVAKKKRGTKKKAVLRKRAVRKRSGARKAKKAVSKPPKGPELPSEPIGKVTHYFPKVKAAAVLIEREGVGLGDTLYFKGHTTRFKQKVESLQIDHKAVSQAAPEEEIGLRVKSRCREHDLVFKLNA